MNIAYFDCFSGISGNMVLASLIELGVPVAWLKQELSRLPLTGFEIELTYKHRYGIKAAHVQVHVTDHETERTYKTIVALIDHSPLPEEVKQISRSIFHCLATAESHIHGTELDHVHFHELGGIDAIVDIVGTALGVHYLKIDHFFSSPVPLGHGFVQCRHGNLPLPAPATLEILNHIPVYGVAETKELVTPTGAAILATLVKEFSPMPVMRIDKVGYGAGTYIFDTRPNVLRVIMGQSDSQKQIHETSTQTIRIIEATIDDMNPQIYSYVMERLFEAGALDVCWIPVYMKKNRPGIIIQVLCDESHHDHIVHILFSETTTIGLRWYSAARDVLYRELVCVNTDLGNIQAKRILRKDGTVCLKPEYESCKTIAKEKQIPIQSVFDTLNKACLTTSRPRNPI
ncbi:MAG: nickel pincer cofactor biosynthesis protein LarC [Desulfobacterales bacterium]|nr:nickel pincer cofactor biosynthesis protein LarC [Desulfobacterales bacterium]